jgi:UDP-2,4-diacetamido-2,4,6-trideoxy-beta-L-altropyranose hydrolase
MKAVLRVDASAAIGLGHLSRCLTLARGLQRRGVEVDVAMRAPGERTRQWVEREGHRLVALAGDADEIGATLDAIRGADLVVIDGYTFGVDLHDAVLGAGARLCVLDDVGSAPLHADVVLNGNVFAEPLRYERARRCLLGPSYALVREEFVLARARRIARNREERIGRAPRLLVTMGGADPTSATEAFLRGLGESPTPSRIEIRIVVGGANPRADTIAHAAAQIREHDVAVSVAAENMAELMEWSDVTLAAAGSTCLELSCVGVASVVVAVADNQIPVANEVARRKMMTSLGRQADVAGPELFAAALRLLGDEHAGARAEMEATQRAVIDGLGQERVAAALLA